MIKSKHIDHFLYLKEIATAVNKETSMITAVKLEQIAFSIKQSSSYSRISFLFELFLQSKLISFEHVQELFKLYQLEYYEWAIRTFYHVSQKLNNQLFFITLIKKFKGLV